MACEQVVLTPQHLAIIMEYAAGGELFERICNAGRFSEDEVRAMGTQFRNYAELHGLRRFHLIIFLQARFFFQQLVSGISYCHSMVRSLGRQTAVKEIVSVILNR